MSYRSIESVVFYQTELIPILNLAEEVDLETTPEDAIPRTTSFQDWPLAFRVILP